MNPALTAVSAATTAVRAVSFGRRRDPEDPGPPPWVLLVLLLIAVGAFVMMAVLT